MGPRKFTSENKIKKTAPKKQNKATKPKISEKLEIIERAIENEVHLRIYYYTRYRDSWNHRIVTPKRFYFEGKSYFLEAYCYSRQEVRTFNVSNIKTVNILPKAFTETAASREKAVPELEKPSASPLRHKSQENSNTGYIILAIIVLIIFTT
ncbi:MAG: hypothetical protein VR67_03300 [Peptococcaceae bacterium BRH_c8a]|nr:MAG: hypothetical protein VR67_03300 [Peptococcaceae bacterium BRH_c8a]